MTLQPRSRLYIVAFSWTGLFAMVMACDLTMVRTFWGALIRLLVGMASVPAATWIGFYFLCGPREARRWWLYTRFVLANLTRTQVIVARADREARGKGI